MHTQGGSIQGTLVSPGGVVVVVQEEERERRMDFIPEESAIQTDSIEVDKDTMDMLKEISMGALPGLSVVQARAQARTRRSIQRSSVVWLCMP